MESYFCGANRMLPNPIGLYPIGRLVKGLAHVIGLRGAAFRVSVIEKDSPASGSYSRLDIAPAVADKERPGELDVARLFRHPKHAGLRLSAFAIICILVIACDYLIQPQFGPQMAVDCVNSFSCRGSARDIRLIGYYNDLETFGLERPDCFGDLGKYLQFAQIRWCKRTPVTDDCAIDHAIAI
jgi:hypothetical protein